MVSSEMSRREVALKLWDPSNENIFKMATALNLSVEFVKNMGYSISNSEDGVNP